MFDQVLPVRNRPGWFVVLTPEAAAVVNRGYMKLFAAGETIEVETVSRTRKSLSTVDPGFRCVFLAVTPDGQLVTDVA